MQILFLLVFIILAQLCSHDHYRANQPEMVAACNLAKASCYHSLSGSTATWMRSTTLHGCYKHTPAGTHQLISGDSWVVSHFFRLTEALVGGCHFCCLPSVPTYAARNLMFMRPSTIADAQLMAARRVAKRKGRASAYSQPRRESQLQNAALPHETLAAAMLGWVLASSALIRPPKSQPSRFRGADFAPLPALWLQSINLSCIERSCHALQWPPGHRSQSAVVEARTWAPW